jgi:uncharacterized protein YbjT (DUF2867 family)
MSSSAPRTPRVAIVGATGYVAGPLIRELFRVGYPVVGLSRDRRTDAMATFCEAVHMGDLSDIRFVTEATRGCTHIINMVGGVGAMRYVLRW